MKHYISVVNNIADCRTNTISNCKNSHTGYSTTASIVIDKHVLEYIPTTCIVNKLNQEQKLQSSLHPKVCHSGQTTHEAATKAGVSFSTEISVYQSYTHSSKLTVNQNILRSPTPDH